MLSSHLQLVTGPVDRVLAGKAPWQIVALTTTTVLGLIKLWELLSEDESEKILFLSIIYTITCIFVSRPVFSNSATMFQVSPFDTCCATKNRRGNW